MTVARASEAEGKLVEQAPKVPSKNLLLGGTGEFQADPLTYVLKAQREHGDVVRFRFIWDDWFLVSHPEDIHDITVRRPELFHKPKVAKRIWDIFLGNGILPADGEHWKRQHQLMLPAFHKRRIDAYGDTMVQYTSELLDEWRPGEGRDFREDMTALTLRIVGKTLFDEDIARDAPVVGRAMHVINKMLVEHINLPLPLPRWWPTPGNRRKIKAIEDIEGIIKRLIQERRAEGVDHGDLFSMLVFSEYEDGTRMDDKQLRDEAMTLIFAGHETTAHALTWMWHLLAKHPEVVTRMREELDAVVGDRAITVEDLGQLPYLTQVVKESMRTLPSVWSFMREPVCDVTIGGYTVPQGAQLMISQYVVHHDARWHPDPEVFRPERWTKEYERGLPKGAYIPFSAGPRICLGHGFAMMESKLILGTLVQRAEPRVERDYEPMLEAKLSLGPGPGGLPFQVEMRGSAEKAA